MAAALLCACSGDDATSATTPVPAAGARSLADRPDDATGYQVQIVYALPSDGADRQLDTNGTLVTTVDVWQRWLSGQTNGRTLLIDTYQGELDIVFARLSRTDATMKSFGALVRDTIEAEMRRMGLIVAGKLYAVYYDGGSTTSCGGGAWPPDLPGVVGALYLQGTPPGTPTPPPCNSNPFASSATAAPGYLEFAMIHEILHTLGIVSPAAPNHVLRGHVNTSPTDLMYAGPLGWTPTTLDVNRQNYFSPTGLAGGLVNLATSPFLKP